MTKGNALRYSIRLGATVLAVAMTIGTLFVVSGFLTNSGTGRIAHGTWSASRGLLGQGLIPNGGFENGFFGWTVVDSVSVTNSTVYSGNNAIRAADPDTSGYAYIWQELGFAYDTAEVSVWVYPEGSRYRQVFELISGWLEGTPVSITHVTFRNDALIFAAQGTSEWIPKPLTPGTWNHILIKANSSTLTQDLYVNDSLYASITSDELPVIEHLLVGDVSIGANWGTIYYDDISITGSVTTPVPVLVDDEYVDNGVEPKFFPVLRNDVIPAGIPFEITIVDPPEHGQILSIQEDGIWVQKDPGFEGTDKFTYTLMTSDQSTGKVPEPLSPAELLWKAIACACHFAVETNECPPSAPGSFIDPMTTIFGASKGLVADSVDLGLLYRWRDELLRATDAGAALVDDLMFNSPEILQIVLVERPELRNRVVSLFLMLQDPARNLLDGDGSEVITQAQMDSVARLFASVSDNASDELAAIIQDHVEALGPFDKYVGMTVQETFDELGGTSTAAERDLPSQPHGFTLEQNFPNPVQTETTIRYALETAARVDLAVYDIRGRKVRTLARGQLEQGTRTVIWTGQDDSGVEVPSGVYFVRLSSDAVHRTKRLVVVR